MQVRALSAGFFGGARRRPGSVFEVPEGTKGSWFAPVGVTKAPAAPVKQEPQALSQKAAKTGKADSFVDVHKGGADLV